MKLLIKNGHVLNPATNLDRVMDILIEDGKVKTLKQSITNEECDRVIDANGLYVMPGFIDLHVHLREPGFEYKETIESGAKAAATGGFTSICPMPNTKPSTDCREMVELVMDKANKESVVHILPIGAITTNQEGSQLSDFKGMKEAGIVALSEDGKSVMDAALFMRGMQAAKKLNLPIFSHCEDKSLVGKGVMNAGKKAKEFGLEGICNAVEDVIVARDILIAKEPGCTLHLCHCSTKDSVTLVKMAKEMGLSVTAEVCPHHFSMSEDDITEDHGRFKMNPPLRKKEDVEALKKGLRDGIMDVIATDHAPHGQEEKNQSMAKAPFGIVGLETAFALTMTELVKKGYLTPMQMVEKLSYNPAKVLGIDKGNIDEGKVADIVIADFDREYQIDAKKFASKGKNTPFDGKMVTGQVVTTIVSGEVVYEN
ncbi:dihydroorotase [Lachnospiraceae bacterium KM106-2]|nr:dihydroorotase [Lachnospiraceae bacterium KM106-2]